MSYKKNILVLISLILTMVGSPLFAQKVNKTDKEGKKQGKWIYFGKDRPDAGYPDNGKIEEGTFQDDRKEGYWTKYYNDGKTPKLKGEYENNRPKGNYVKYFENGKIKEQGTFIRDKYLDTLRRFHENGVLEYEAKYNEAGKEEGAVSYYYANGQVEFEYISKDGKPTGKAIRYYENGDIKEILSSINEYNSLKEWTGKYNNTKYTLYQFLGVITVLLILTAIYFTIKFKRPDFLNYYIFIVVLFYITNLVFLGLKSDKEMLTEKILKESFVNNELN